MVSKLDTIPTYFAKTLNLLKETFPDIPVLVKPHPTLKDDIVQNIISKSGHKSASVTYLHSAILGRICTLAICNQFSYAMPDCFIGGARCIEFTSYAETIKVIANHNGLRPEYIDAYVDSNPEEFVSVAKRLWSEGRKTRKFSVKKMAEKEQLIRALTS